MIKTLHRMVDQRVSAASLSQKSCINAHHAVRMLEPVFALGVRSASVPKTWVRFADRCIDEGLKASTLRQRIDCVAAVLAWVVRADISFTQASPGSIGRILAAMRDASREIGRRIKRYRPMSKPARASVGDLAEVVTQINAIREPHRSALAMMLCFGLRPGEAISMTPESIISGNRLFIAGRMTKTRSDLLLPLPLGYMPLIEGWARNIGGSDINYDATAKAVSRAGVKWRCHDLRKIFRTAAAVRGDDYLACELILNHTVKDVPATYLQNPPYTAMRKVLENSIGEYLKLKG